MDNLMIFVKGFIIGFFTGTIITCITLTLLMYFYER